MSRTSSVVKDRYNKKAYDEFKIRVFKGNKEKIKAYCDSKGMSVNSFINKLINDCMAADGYELATEPTANKDI